MDQKRAVIVAAALDAFLDAGYAGASVNHIAAAAGVSIKTLYRHYDSKDDLFSAVMQRLEPKKNACLTDLKCCGLFQRHRHPASRKRKNCSCPCTKNRGYQVTGGPDREKHFAKGKFHESITDQIRIGANRQRGARGGASVRRGLGDGSACKSYAAQRTRHRGRVTPKAC